MTSAAHVRFRVRRLTLYLGMPTTLSSVFLLLALPDGPRAVAAPLCVIVNIAVWFLVVLWNRNSTLPAFEVGTMCVAATAVYSAYPLVAFLMAGGVWTEISDNRLLQLAPDWRLVGDFSWRNVLYLGAFALVYLTVRGWASADGIPMRNLSRAATLALVWLFLAITTYFSAIWVLFGVTYDPAYRDVQLKLVGVARDLPYALQQLSHNLKAILLILKLCGIAILLHYWRLPASRLVLGIWLTVEILLTALRMGARTDTVFLLLGTVLLYHRLVRRLGLAAIGLGAALCGAVLLYGFARDFAGVPAGAGTPTFWSAANEFQILFGTAYDIHAQQAAGTLAPIPWQVYASDALRVIPSQLLPIPKVEPADWYLDAVGLAGQQGLMFGVVAQAIIGYDWLELLGRGAALGLVFGLVHRWYVRNASSFWASMLYLYICAWAYYTFRASTFYFLYVILYRFVPAMIAVRVGSWLVRSAARRPAIRTPNAAAPS